MDVDHVAFLARDSLQRHITVVPNARIIWPPVSPVAMSFETCVHTGQSTKLHSAMLDIGTKEARAVMLYFISMPGLAVSKLRIPAPLHGATLLAYAVLVTTMFNKQEQ